MLYLLWFVTQCTILKKTVALPEDEDSKYYTNLLNKKLDEATNQDQLTEIYEDSDYKNTSNQFKTIDKQNELFQIKQAIIIEESNDDLFVNLSESLATNKISNTDQINYSLLEICKDSDKIKMK
ncbi:34847_t:CDS:2, partial [Gigaspora margarita]